MLFWYLIFFFAFFNASFRVKDADMLYQLSPATAVLKGQIASIPTSDTFGKTKFFFKADSVFLGSEKKENIDANTYVTLVAKDGDFSKFSIGDNYELKGTLRVPFVATNPSQFD